MSSSYVGAPLRRGYIEIPAGTDTIGTPAAEPGRDADEGPQNVVTISTPSSVVK